MTAARIFGALGRILMAAGALILLFVAYQLWGTQISTHQAQGDLRAEFEQVLAAATTTTTTSSTVVPDAIPAPSDLPPPVPGEPMGRIVIPSIGVDYIFLEGVDLPLLQDGPGHFPSTPRPGQAGNAALAGHRTTFAAPFHRLDELQPGDPIEITTVQGDFRYEVMEQPPAEEGGPPLGHFIVQPADVWILDQGPLNTLTLMACHPKYSAAQRIVVTAELVGTPAPTTATPEPGPDALPDEGRDLLLTNESEALGPALAWATLAAAIAAAIWWAGRRWRRWPAYLLGAVPFLVVLYLCFEQIARLMPAAY